MLRKRKGRSRRSVAVMVAVTVVVVAGIAGGVWWWTHRSSSAEAAASSTRLVAASTSTVKETVSATGTIEPATQASLSFAQSGKVTAVPVKVGDNVTAGQVLATIDPTSLQSALTLAQEQLTAAQAQQTAANSSDSSSQIASANAQVTNAQTKVTAAQTALADASLTSTITGTVAAVNVAVGDTVSGSGSSGSGSGSSGGSGSGGGTGSTGTGSSASASSTSSSAAFTVITTDAWVVDATVGASDLPHLKNGLQATITPSGGSTQSDPVFGTVSSVGVIGTTSGGTSTFPVTIAVTGSPTGLYAGTSASVVITYKQVDDVLTVPTAAIHEENGQTVVYQMKDGSQVSTPVTVGTVYGTTTSITKGISSGDEVVVTTAGRLGTGTGRSGTGTNRSGTGGTGTGGFTGGSFGGGSFGGGQGGPPAGGAPGGGNP